MILNENVPCRGSRAWWLPFTALGLGLFAMPVAAQEEEAPVRVEVRVNGKKVEQLSGEARRILLERLQREEEEEAEARPGKKKTAAGQDPVAKKSSAKTAKPGRNKKVSVLEDFDLEGFDFDMGDFDLEGLHDQIRAGLKSGLAEARKEIRDNEDLRELGITDDVLDLLDNIGSGKGLDKNIDSIVKAAMKGASNVVKELQADGTLRDLDVHHDIGKFVKDLLEKGHDAEKIKDLVLRTGKSVLHDAKVDVLHDSDIKKLGIGLEVEGLLDDVMSGKGNFNRSLQKLIDKAIKSALREESEENEEVEAEEVKPAPKKKLERKNKSRDDVLIR